MYGSDAVTGSLFSYVDLEDRVPAKRRMGILAHRPKGRSPRPAAAVSKLTKDESASPWGSGRSFR